MALEQRFGADNLFIVQGGALGVDSQARRACDAPLGEWLAEGAHHLVAAGARVEEVYRPTLPERA